MDVTYSPVSLFKTKLLTHLLQSMTKLATNDLTADSVQVQGEYLRWMMSLMGISLKSVTMELVCIARHE